MHNKQSKASLKILNSERFEIVLYIIGWPDFDGSIAGWSEDILDQIVEENNEDQKTIEKEKKSAVSSVINLKSLDLLKETDFSEMF